MKLHRIVSGSLEKLENKEYQIGIGISLGNKWFTVDNIIELTKWSLNFSKDKVIIYVADEIHAINLEVRKGISKEKSLNLADELGNNILNEVESRLKSILTGHDFKKLVFAKWKDLVDDKFQDKVNWLYQKYGNDTEFRNEIENLIKEMTSNEVRNFDIHEIYKLGMYILEELPECLYQVKIKEHECHAWVYPYANSPLIDFIEEIQQGKIYPEIKEKIIDTELKVLLEVR